MAEAASYDLPRKLVHVGVGAFSLLLAKLEWWQAAIAAVVALLFNLLILPALVGRRLHKGHEASRFSLGIVLYPATVLALILLYPHRLEIAAGAWALLAVGDPSAAVAGRAIGSGKLPWNREKSWAGTIAYAVLGGLACGFLILWTRPGHFSGGETLALALVGGVVGAIVESLPTKLDDNVTAPILASIPLALLATTFDGPSAWPLLAGPGSVKRLGVALLVNGAVLALALGTRILSVSGAVSGFVVGSAMLFFGGWPGYAILWTFFALGTVVTKWKYAQKAKVGAAQANRGKRGAKEAFANCTTGVSAAALMAGCGARADLAGFRAGLAVALVASFATALADTFGSEVGSALGKTPRLVTTWKKVPPGTDGAVSIPGTLAGVVGGALVAAVGVATHLVPMKAAPVIVVAAVLASLLESFLGATLERKNLIDNEVQNFANTLAGALLAASLLRFVR